MYYYTLTDVSVDGTWDHWHQWLSCDVSCGGGGSRTRHRTCNDPTPMCGGISCIGNSEESEDCGDECCPGNA